LEGRQIREEELEVTKQDNCSRSWDQTTIISWFPPLAAASALVFRLPSVIVAAISGVVIIAVLGQIFLGMSRLTTSPALSLNSQSSKR
jgi:hypothetical protein